MRSTLFLLFITLFLLGGCYTKQVRHLASDAALITPGQSTVRDVQTYLGEPNGRREVSPGVTEYVYYEDRPGFFGNTPVLSSLAGPSGYEMIIVTISQGIVSNCDFRNFNESDHEWVKDFTWEEVK